jgi:hypothetical protein
VNQLALPVGDLVSNLTFQSKTVTKSKLYQTEAARNLYPRYTIHISKVCVCVCVVQCSASSLRW